MRILMQSVIELPDDMIKQVLEDVQARLPAGTVSCNPEIVPRLFAIRLTMSDRSEFAALMNRVEGVLAEVTSLRKIDQTLRFSMMITECLVV
ncbi:MAG: hypothetical protein Greene041619_112 [Candidatus Peregrinibacteria bacterium Greene0416_19]|nr:MAG: hypothetical protein Greene041619_112 [Candidatus Peregrinibacteria bacterium Greene0416_19]